MKRFLKTTLGTAVLAACAVACTMLFPCVEIYLRNRDFFALSPLAALGFAVPGFLICFFAGAVVPIFLRKNPAFSTAIAILLGGAVSLLLQYLVWSDFFPEQVDGLSLSDMLLLGGLHLFLLLLPPAIAVYFRRAVCRNAIKIAVVIVLTQIVSVFAAYRECRAQDYDFTEYTISEETKFEFARDENVIILVVDAMGERICKEVLEKYPELRTVFRDFICFDRMVSPIPRTIYAVPAMLTGLEYPERNGKAAEGDHAEYLNRACRAPNSVFQGLKRNGFRTEGYPFILQTISYDPEVIDNSIPITYHAEKRSAVKILDAALNRQVPFYVKPLLEDYYYFATDPFVTPRDEAAIVPADEPFDVTFFRRLKREFRVGNRDRVFKYLHLHGAHDPVRTDEQLEPNPETTKLRQLRGALRIVESLLAKLQAADLYDRATIVVIGDHTEFYRPENLAFVKLKQQKSDALRFNSVPCRVADVAGTVLKETYPSEGLRSLFDLPPVWGRGECRTSAMKRNLRFGGWTRAAFPDMTGSMLYSKSFYLEDDRVVIEPESAPDGSASEIALVCRNIATGECWKSECLFPGKDGRLWESPPLAFPDGAYQLFLRHSCAGGRECHQSLPRFLVIAGGKGRWSKNYPNVTPRAMRIGETIVIRPMRPYPQLDFGEGADFHEDGVILGKERSLNVRLPEMRTSARLEFRLKNVALPQGKLILSENDTELAEIAVKDAPELVISTVLPPGNARTAMLRFRFEPRLRNRETRAHWRIYLQGAGLRTISDEVVQQ